MIRTTSDTIQAVPYLRVSGKGQINGDGFAGRGRERGFPDQ